MDLALILEVLTRRSNIARDDNVQQAAFKFICKGRERNRLEMSHPSMGAPCRFSIYTNVPDP